MSESRLVTALRSLVREFTAQTAYHAPVRYRVVTLAGDRVNLQVVKKGPYPDVLPISIRMGIPGGVAELAQGSIVLVMFIEGDPAMPVVTHFSESAEAGWKPVSMRIDADELVLGDPIASVGRLIARVGDPAGPFVITGGSLKARCE